MLKLALTPKWIMALIGSVLMGLVFAALAQWQISRSILPTSSETYSKIVYQNIDQVIQPNQPYTFQELDSKTKVLSEVIVRSVQHPQGAVLVNNRIQLDGSRGSWIVIPVDTDKARLFVAVAFVPETMDPSEALNKVKSMPPRNYSSLLVGRYLPSEAPVEASEIGFESMSVAQLLNQGDDIELAYSGFLAITRPNIYVSQTGLEQITIGLAKADTGLNWLSVFYALEWIFFALFGLFMWWRLLADSYKKQQLELAESTEKQ